jgi:hypothetical protein
MDRITQRALPPTSVLDYTKLLQFTIIFKFVQVESTNFYTNSTIFFPPRSLRTGVLLIFFVKIPGCFEAF